MSKCPEVAVRVQTLTILCHLEMGGRPELYIWDQALPSHGRLHDPLPWHSETLENDPWSELTPYPCLKNWTSTSLLLGGTGG